VENLTATGVCLPTWEKTLALQMSVMSCVTWHRREINWEDRGKTVVKVKRVRDKDEDGERQKSEGENNGRKVG